MNLMNYLLFIFLVMTHLFHDRYSLVDIRWLRVVVVIYVPLYQSWWDVYTDSTFFKEKGSVRLIRLPTLV